MQHTIQNLFGAMPPNELPKKIELEGIPDVEVYYPAHAPEDETINWYNEPFKVKAMRWNERAPSFWLQWKFRTNMGWLNGKELTPERSQQIDDHSPDGFAWGYGGSTSRSLRLPCAWSFTELHLVIAFTRTLNFVLLLRGKWTSALKGT